MRQNLEAAGQVLSDAAPGVHRQEAPGPETGPRSPTGVAALDDRLRVPAAGRPRLQQSARVFRRPHAAADRERNRDLITNAAHRFEPGHPSLRRGRDIQDHEFVRPFALVASGEPGGVALIFEVVETDALHDPAVPHIQAWNDPNVQHAAASGPFHAACSNAAAAPGDSSSHRLRRLGADFPDSFRVERQARTPPRSSPATTGFRAAPSRRSRPAGPLRARRSWEIDDG